MIYMSISSHLTEHKVDFEKSPQYLLFHDHTFLFPNGFSEVAGESPWAIADGSAHLGIQSQYPYTNILLVTL